MSTEATRTRSEIRRAVSPSAFMVWDALQELPVVVSISQIERATSLTRNTINKAIEELEQQELLERQAVCPRCGRRRAGQCQECGSAEPPNYSYRMIGVGGAILFGIAGLIAPGAATAATIGGAFAQAHGLTNLLLLLSSKLFITANITTTSEIDVPESAENSLSVISKGADLAAIPPQNVAQNLDEISPYIFGRESFGSNEPRPLAEEQKKRKRQKWYDETRSYAEHSARILGDKAIGVHINAWAIARKAKLRDELVEIILVCEKQKQATGKPQGKAFSFLSKQLFLKHGLLEIPPDQAAIRAQIAASIAASGGYDQ